MWRANASVRQWSRRTRNPRWRSRKIVFALCRETSPSICWRRSTNAPNFCRTGPRNPDPIESHRPDPTDVLFFVSFCLKHLDDRSTEMRTYLQQITFWNLYFLQKNKTKSALGTIFVRPWQYNHTFFIFVRSKTEPPNCHRVLFLRQTVHGHGLTGHSRLIRDSSLFIIHLKSNPFFHNLYIPFSNKETKNIVESPRLLGKKSRKGEHSSAYTFVCIEKN